MAQTEEWGDGAFAAALEELTPVPEPSSTRTPLEQEVVDLSHVVVGQGGSPTAGLPNMDDSWWERVTRVVVDAVVARDKVAIDLLDGLLRRLHRLLAIAQREQDHGDGSGALGSLRQAEAWLQMAMEFVRTAQERIAPMAFAAAVAGTHRESFLRIVAQNPGINSRKVGERMRAARSTEAGRGAVMDEAQLSRLGKRLRTDRLVVANRGGSGLSWELSPLGELVVEQLLESEVGSPIAREQSVDNMVIAVGPSAASEVAATLSANAPREVTLVCDDESVTYERRDGLPPQRSSELEPVSVTAAVHELVDRPEVGATPAAFSLTNGVVYEQVP